MCMKGLDYVKHYFKKYWPYVEQSLERSNLSAGHPLRKLTVLINAPLPRFLMKHESPRAMEEIKRQGTCLGFESAHEATASVS